MCNCGVRLLAKQRLDSILLCGSDVVLVTLHEHENVLVPDDWHLALVVLEADKIGDQRIDHAIWKRVLFV